MGAVTQASALQVRSHSPRFVQRPLPGVVGDLSAAERSRQQDLCRVRRFMFVDVVENQLADGHRVLPRKAVGET